MLLSSLFHAITKPVRIAPAKPSTPVRIGQDQSGNPSPKSTPILTNPHQSTPKFHFPPMPGSSPPNFAGSRTTPSCASGKNPARSVPPKPMLSTPCSKRAQPRPASTSGSPLATRPRPSSTSTTAATGPNSSTSLPPTKANSFWTKRKTAQPTSSSSPMAVASTASPPTQTLSPANAATSKSMSSHSTRTSEATLAQHRRWSL